MDIVFSLILNNKEITKPIGISCCSNLIILNISKNKFTNIDDLSNLNKLKILDISFNSIKSVDALFKLEKLTNLKAQGNKIEKISNIDVWFKGLKSITKIYFQDVSGNNSNPLCKEDNYRSSFFQSSKSLKQLDGTKKDISLINEMNNIIKMKPKDNIDVNSFKFDFIEDKDFNVENLFQNAKYNESITSVNRNADKLKNEIQQALKGLN